MSGGNVTGGPFPPSAVPDCIKYPTGTVLINTSNTSDPNYAALQTFLAAQAAQAALPNYLAAYRAQLAKGLALTSTGTPSLNATYPLADCVTSLSPVCTLVSQAQIAKLNNTQVYGPLGATTVSQADITGTLHNFDRDHMIAWGNAIAGYLAQCSFQAYVAAGNNFPSNSVTIP